MTAHAMAQRGRGTAARAARWIVTCSALTGCGRIGFDPLDARSGMMRDATAMDGSLFDEDMQPDGAMMGCPAGHTRCRDALCVHLQRDNRHCGACDAVCPPDSTCEMGTCVGRAIVPAGTDCTDSTECGRNVIASGFCLTTIGGWANGYCSFHCRTSADCAMNEACVNEPGTHIAPYSDATGVCLQRCVAPGGRVGCPSNSICVARGSDAVCVAACETSVSTCGGNTCNVISGSCVECGSPAECRGGGACNAGRCTCTATTDCGLFSQCIAATGRCGCANNLYCPEGMQCNTTTGDCERR